MITEVKYDPIKKFVERLKKIGIEVKLFGNFPWVYLDEVNGKSVRGTFQSEKHFTAFWLATRVGQENSFTDVREVFKKVRETLGE